MLKLDGGIALAAAQRPILRPGNIMAKNQTGGGDRSATDLLTQDHKRVQKLFKDFEKVDRADENAVRELVETACLELQIHSMLEEEIFYPAVRARVDDQEREDLLNQAEVEHETIDELIAKLHALEPDDAMYAAYFTVLAEYVRHHIKQEEQELFPAVQDMSALDLDQIGEDMRVRREELFAEMESGEDETAEQESELEGSAMADDDDAADAVDDELEDEQEQIDISRTRH
jgi:hemerythrin superfamily protein